MPDMAKGKRKKANTLLMSQDLLAIQVAELFTPLSDHLAVAGNHDTYCLSVKFANLYGRSEPANASINYDSRHLAMPFCKKDTLLASLKDPTEVMLG